MSLESLKKIAPNVQEIISVNTPDLPRLGELIRVFIADCIHAVEYPASDDPVIMESIQNLWSISAKDVALLLRNIYFRIYRDLQFTYDNTLEQAQFEKRNLESAEVVDTAFQELFYLHDQLLQAILPEDSLSKKWKHYESPVLIFRDQMDTISDQIELILEGNSVLNADREQVKQHEEKNDLQQAKIKNDIAQLKNNISLVKEAVNAIEDVEDQKNITAAKSTLKRVFETVELIKDSYSEERRIAQKYVPRQIAIGIQGGNLIIKEVSVLGQIASWIEKHIYPSIYEAGRSVALTCDNLLVSLVNVQNRLNISSSEQGQQQVFLKSSILEPLNNLGIEPDQLYEEILSSLDHVNQKFEDNVIVSNVFDRKHLLFKDIDFRSQGLKNGDQSWLSVLPLVKLKEKTAYYYKQILDPGYSSSRHQTVINFIDNKIIKSLDQYNHSLFLNKGYLGKSFMVDRTKISAAIKKHYTAWLGGYRGSMLVSGARLSGKSTLLESAFNSETQVDTISLKPERSITFQGRKFDVNYDLRATLAFIDKYAYNRKVIVIIDDLELWRDKDQPLYSNITALIEFMGKSYKRIFFAVAINQWIKKQFDLYFNFTTHFVSHFSVNRMDPQEIQKALLIRHGATISELVYKDNEVRNNGDLHKQTLAVAAKSKGNIGNALHNWCRFSFGHDLDEDDIFEIPQAFVKLVNHHQILLKYILQCQVTTESEISSDIGSRFVKRVGPDIQKLLGHKLLIRDTDGHISLNEYLVNDVEAVMKYNSNKIAIHV